MSIMGIGTLEILVILLLAFIVLGPERMVDAGRLLGKAVREARRLTDELPRISLEENEPAKRPSTQRQPGASTNSELGGDDNENRTSEANKGPIAFKAHDEIDPPDTRSNL